MNDTLDLGIEIPTSARCPHYTRNRGRRHLVECHEPTPIKRRKGESMQRWKCVNCKREIRWDPDYSMHVLPYLIEEVPW